MIKIRSKISFPVKMLVSLSYVLAFLFVVIFFYYEGDKWSFADTKVIFIFAGVPSLLLILGTVTLGSIGFLGLSEKYIYIKDDVSLKETWFFEIPFEMVSDFKALPEKFVIKLLDGDEKEVLLKNLVFLNDKNESISSKDVQDLIRNKLLLKETNLLHVRRISQSTLEKMLDENSWYNSLYARVIFILSLLGGLYFMLNRF